MKPATVPAKAFFKGTSLRAMPVVASRGAKLVTSAQV
jgi:hypothetical protein